jgi:hypothetical protein
MDYLPRAINPTDKLQVCGEQRVKIPAMRKSLSTLAALLLIGGNAFADSFRVHYSIHGSGRDITVQAESSAEARRIVLEMFGKSCVVTGVHRIKSR